MGSKFLINYLRQKWWQMPELYVSVSLYWECRYAYPVQLWTSINLCLLMPLAWFTLVASVNTVNRPRPNPYPDLKLNPNPKPYA